MVKPKKAPTKATHKTSFNKGQRMAILFGLSSLFVVGILSGALSYATAYVGCFKAPVVASKFAASYSYILPGEEGYGPSMFGQSYFCSQAEAEAAGYHHSPLTEGSRAELAQQINKEASSRNSIDFTLYTPTLTDYSLKYADVAYGGEGNSNSTFVTASIFKKDEKIGTIIMRRIDTERALCDPAYYQCSTIGVDTQGREVKKVIKSKNNVGSRYQIGVKIDNTSIVIFSDTELNEQDIIQVFGSLQPDRRPPNQW